jgi:hypothetical protein
VHTCSLPFPGSFGFWRCSGVGVGFSFGFGWGSYLSFFLLGLLVGLALRHLGSGLGQRLQLPQCQQLYY